MAEMKILGLILARKYSKRFPGKNRLGLGPTRLVDFAINAMRESPEITDYAVSTDDEMIAEYCDREGVAWIRRPDEMCTDISDIKEAITHAGQLYNPEYVVSFQCAVPLRPVGSTSALIQEVLRSKANGGLSMIKRTPWLWKIDKRPHMGATKNWYLDTYPRSQDLPYNMYEEINAIQVTHKSVMGRRWRYPLSIVELPGWADFDIDDEEDYWYCQKMWDFIKGEYFVPREYNTFTIQYEF